MATQISTRKAYGVALKRMGDASPRVVALDGDTKNSTFSDIFKKAHPDRYIECFIAEQNMVCIWIFFFFHVMMAKQKSNLTVCVMDE